MVEIEVVTVRQETIKEAEFRFQRRYFELWPDAPMTWLVDHLEPLVRLAVPDYDQLRRIEELTKESVRANHRHGRAARLNSIDQFIDHYTGLEPVWAARK